MRKIDLVERVVDGVMDIKISGRVELRRDDRHAEAAQGAKIGAAARGVSPSSTSSERTTFCI